MWHVNLRKKLKALAFEALSLTVNLLRGSGLGRLPPAKAVYRQLCRSLIPDEKRLLHINGYKMLLDSSYDLTELVISGTWEKFETAMFKQLVHEDMTVVDIGASTGYYTLLAAKLVGEKGKVFAFEPEPENYTALLKNIEINGYKNIIPVNKAVFSSTGKFNLFLGKYCGAHSLYQVGDTASTIYIDTTTLDDFFEGREDPIHIIKMDIEGAEMAALLGMSRILEQNEGIKLFTEFWTVALEKTDFSPQEYWDKLIQCGFKFIYFINESKQRLEPTDFASFMRFCKNATDLNLLCTRSPLKVNNH